MKLIKSSIELIPQAPGYEGIEQQIEKAGRTCYKSEDRITAGSAAKFVETMIGSGHLAMLEHGTVYLRVPMPVVANASAESDWDMLRKNPYTRTNVDSKYYYFTTNLRVIIENVKGCVMRYRCEPTEHHERRVTVRFICDRGVSHEFVRHRVMSFAQESTRYCNYSKDKFGKELTFIIPSGCKTDESGQHVSPFPGPPEIVLLSALRDSEAAYFTLLEHGWKPQQARAVLPNALKTELVVTGFISDWRHFLSLRSPMYGARGVHPDAARLADMVYEKLSTLEYFKQI